MNMENKNIQNPNSAATRSIGSTTGFHLNVKALLGAFNQEKALVWAFSKSVKTD